MAYRERLNTESYLFPSIFCPTFCRQRTGINEVIASFSKYREEMLKALDHPGLPLHNNDSEQDIRGVAKRRNISGTTKSVEGRQFRDGLLTLKQTCARLGVSFWEYLSRWFRGDPIDLAQFVHERYQTASPATP